MCPMDKINLFWRKNGKNIGVKCWKGENSKQNRGVNNYRWNDDKVEYYGEYKNLKK